MKIIVARTVHMAGNSRDLQSVVAGRHQECSKHFHVPEAWIDPAVEGLAVQDHRHSFVNRFGRLVCYSRDDGAGLYDRSIAGRTIVLLPQTGKQHWPSVTRLDQVRLFAIIGSLPLVVAVGDNQATLSGKCFSKRWFTVDGFTAGIDHPIADLQVIRPRRY